MVVKLKLEAYIRPVYEEWDREKKYPPPHGYATWVEYLEKYLLKQ